MGSIYSASISFTRFRVIDPIPSELLTQIPEKLRQFAFRDIDDLPEMQAYGWVCFEDMLDTGWRTAPPQKGNYFTFSLRLDTRRIPPAIIKKQLSLALKAEKEKMQAQGKKFISRERKKDLKEQVLLRLRQRFLPVPAEFHVVWEPDRNEVWFASTQGKMIDLFMEAFLNTFELHLEQIEPYSLAEGLLDDVDMGKLDRSESTRFTGEPGSDGLMLGNVLGEEFLTWLWFQSDVAPGAFVDKDGQPFSVSMEQRIVVQGGQGEAKETASVAGTLSPLTEARFGLGKGKKVTRATIRLEKDELAFQFTLSADDFTLGSMKLPKVEKPAEDEDPDAMLLERFYLMEVCLGLLESLYASFLRLRLSADWSETVQGITAWIKRE